MQDLEPLPDQDGIAESLISRIGMSKEELHLLQVFGQGLQAVLPEASLRVLRENNARSAPLSPRGLNSKTALLCSIFPALSSEGRP